MKKVIIFIALSIFLLIFFIHPKKVVAGELDCTATGVSGMILDENNQSVGTVWLSLTGGSDNPSTLNSKDGSFTFSGGYFGQVNGIGELTLSYNFPSDSPYESGNVILSQCTGSIIRIKSIEPAKEVEKTESIEENGIPSEKTPSCTTYIEESTHKVRVENLTPGEEYQIWIVLKTSPLRRDVGTEYYGDKFTPDSSTYKFPIQVGENWKKGTYEVEINTGESTFWKRRGDFIGASCSFELYGYEESNQEKAAEENKVTQTEYEVPDLPLQINKIVNYSTGIGGLIAFILIIIGGLQIILSAGNPDRVKAGKEMITSAIAGLLLIIFAVFILKLIGYDILRIPEFGE